MWNISTAFANQLRNPNHQISAKAQLLDAAYREIPDGEFFTPGADDFQDYIVDGNVDVDRDRGTRRTAEITILNKDGEFTPSGLPDYTGKFYVNRIIRLYRGVIHPAGPAMYVPVGTFMVDAIDTIVERNMSTVNLTLSDPWKKFTKALVTRTQTYPAGTHFNTIVRDFASWSGADYPLAPALDDLIGPERSAANTTLQSKLTMERGENRGEILKTLADRFGVDLYFNVEGRLVSHDRRDPKDGVTVWHFYTSARNDGMLVSVRRTMSDDNLYNHVFVIGLGNETAPVIWEKKNTDNSSFTSIDRLGQRVLIYESQTWKTYEQVKEAGERFWAKRFNLFEDITIDTICNPALEADDVIHITEPTSRVDSRFRIRQMNIPLTTSKQTIHTSRNVYV
jgi:hypothetical protein